MYRNYSTFNVFNKNNKNDSNTSFSDDDDSFGIEPYYKEKYIDEDLNNKSTMFFSTMDSFYSQKKELEEFDNETDYKINEMNTFYDNTRTNFINKFDKRKKTIIDDYSNSIGRNNCFRAMLCKKIKTKEMDNQLESAKNSYLEYIEKKRNDAINNYRSQRNLAYNKKKIQHENFWKKNNNMKLLDC